MTTIKKEWLACPVTKEDLTEQNGELRSSQFSYQNKGSYWDFIPKNLEALNAPIWKSWSQLQENGISSYTNAPANNLGVGPRQDYIAFGEFCDYHGIVLDVGVGPQNSPTHIQYSPNKNFDFVGVDPIVGTQPRDFAFVLALGEYLPFKEGIFDQVLFTTSLDHFIDPVIALKEAKRVLKDNGEICIWIGEKDKNAPKPKESPEWYKKLQIPEGAEDPFHFKRFTVHELLEYFIKAGLKIKARKDIVVDQWRTNIFFKVEKQ